MNMKTNKVRKICVNHAQNTPFRTSYILFAASK